MADDLIPFREKAERLTCTATTAVVGKRFVVISGDAQADGTYSVAPAGAGAKALGVACWSAASGARVVVIPVEAGQVVPIKAGETLAANDSITPGAAGVASKAVADADASGIVLTGAANGADAQVLLGRHTA